MNLIKTVRETNNAICPKKHCESIFEQGFTMKNSSRTEHYGNVGIESHIGDPEGKSLKN